MDIGNSVDEFSVLYTTKHSKRKQIRNENPVAFLKAAASAVLYAA
jgi:hypothetical protein